uniref:Uncharacterized protein n=1 Tax=Lactuca sativa TaxID=4236 RepID=A0A9R1ULR4_LACSA|nr:hypothetical protein LSAT_V11C800413270 [Lactuca sativa]
MLLHILFGAFINPLKMGARLLHDLPAAPPFSLNETASLEEPKLLASVFYRRSASSLPLFLHRPTRFLVVDFFLICLLMFCNLIMIDEKRSARNV